MPAGAGKAFGRPRVALCGVGNFPPLSDKFREPIKKRSLTGEDFLVRETQIEPFRAVDFWKGLQTPAFRRPLHIERIAGDSADIDVALDSEGMNAFIHTCFAATARGVRIPPVA